MIFKIKTDSGEYVAMFSRYEWSYSACRIYKKTTKSIFWFKFSTYEEVWVNYIESISLGEPEFLYDWAKKSVTKYEDYKKAWDDWSKKK